MSLFRGYLGPFDREHHRGGSLRFDGKRSKSYRRTGCFIITCAAVLSLTACSTRALRYPRADVIVVLIDTLRADGLSCYGNPRQTSPGIDRLAQMGVVFDVAFAPAPQTGPSLATLFTARYPWVHRVANYHGPGLPDSFVSLADKFRAAGYQTAAITDGGILSGNSGFARGFGYFYGRYEGVEEKVDRALDFLETRRDGRPLFLFLHTYQIHQPYVSPRHWVERFDPAYDGILRPAEEQVRRHVGAGGEGVDAIKFLLKDATRFTPRDVAYLRALYDAAIAYTDHELARLWTYLDKKRRLDETLLVITSDHGEEFNEHGHLGHKQLYRESVQVPLILRLPGGAANPVAGTHVSTPVALLDLHRTLLAAVGIAGHGPAEGVSLMEALGTGRTPELPIFAATTDHFYKDAADQVSRMSVRYQGYFRLRLRDDFKESRYVYDSATDPAENRPLPSTQATARLIARLDERLDQHLSAQRALRLALLNGQEPGHRRLDRRTLDELRSLGYIDR